jgi:hypothetical protein
MVPFMFKKKKKRIKQTIAGHQSLTPVILAIQEAEVRRIAVLSQPRQENLSVLQMYETTSLKRAGGKVLTSVTLETFETLSQKIQYHKKVLVDWLKV